MSVAALIDEIRLRLPDAVGMTADSRTLRRGDVFLAMPGAVHDGRQHIPAAVAAGAAGILWEPEGYAWPAAVDLPNWPLPSRVGVSTRYWQFAGPDDPRLTITPDIAVPVRAADYFADRDPVLEAVLAD